LLTIANAIWKLTRTCSENSVGDYNVLLTVFPHIIASVLDMVQIDLLFPSRRDSPIGYLHGYFCLFSSVWQLWFTPPRMLTHFYGTLCDPFELSACSGSFFPLSRCHMHDKHLCKLYGVLMCGQRIRLYLPEFRWGCAAASFG